MKIKFIKKHSVGIEIGRVVSADKIFAERMVKEGYAEFVKDEPVKEEPKKKPIKRASNKKVEKTVIDNKKVEPVKKVKNTISTKPNTDKKD